MYIPAFGFAYSYSVNVGIRVVEKYRVLCIFRHVIPIPKIFLTVFLRVPSYSGNKNSACCDTDVANIISGVPRMLWGGLGIWLFLIGDSGCAGNDICEYFIYCPWLCIYGEIEMHAF